jgi:hypothetical protein
VFPVGPGCPVGQFDNWALDILPGAVLVSVGQAQWHFIGAWDCLTPLTLTIFSDTTTGCQGWPATITIYPG